MNAPDAPRTRPWDPQFGTKHPGIDSLCPWEGWPSWAHWPELLQLQAVVAASRPPVTNGSGQPLRLERAAGRQSAAAFEQRVATDGLLAVRLQHWHDLFNVLAWVAWPRSKARLNARHVVELAGETTGLRSRVRDALTGFDEDGVVVAVSDPQLERLAREFRWKALFWDHRSELEQAFRVFAFGHALAEKLLDPFVGLTAKAVFLPVDGEFCHLEPIRQRELLDRRLALRLSAADDFTSPRTLAPLPVLGLPGWWGDGDDPAFYADAAYFRPGRSSAP